MRALPQVLITEDRIRNTIGQLADLARHISALAPKPYASEFAALLKDAHQKISDHIGPRIEQIRATAANKEAEIRTITTLGLSIDNLYYYLHSAFVGYQSCLSSARSLFYLCDWYSERFERHPTYIISIGPTVASVTSFNDLLYYLTFDQILPAAWDQLKDKKFYFVQVAPELATDQASLKWPIVLHEFSHIIDIELDIVEGLYPRFKYIDLIKIVTDGKFPHAILSYCREKLQAIEYAADLLTSTVLGPAYAWCFVRNFFEAREIIDPPPVHPPMHKRILTLGKFLLETSFQKDADDLKRTLAELVAGLGEFKNKSNKEVLDLLDEHTEKVKSDDLKLYDQLVQRVRIANQNRLTCQQLEQLLRESQPAEVQTDQMINAAMTKLATGRAPVFHPSLLFYVATRSDLKDLVKPLREMKEDTSETDLERIVQEIIADKIRLYSVKKEAESRLQKVAKGQNPAS